MSTSNGKITAPVTIGDIARTIGVASGDLGTLCTSGIINKWSKYKPEQYMSFNELTDEQHRNAVNLVGTIVPYGLFKKPAATGSYHCTGATVNSVESLTNQSDIDTVKEGMKWGYEGRVRKDDNNQIGEINGKPIYATQGGFPCRLSDFNGYYHYSRNPIEIQWVKIKESDEGLGGLFAKITYNDVDTAEDYGGLTREDLGLRGYKLVLIGQSVDNQVITETGQTNHPRYVIAGHSSTVIDGKAALGYTDLKLAPLMGDVNFFFVLVNKEIEWDIYAESMNGGICVNPDGWKNDNTYYYPKMKTLPDIAYFVEGSAYRASFPDGKGTMIWSTELWYNYIYSGEYVKVYANAEVYDYQGNTVKFENVYTTFRDWAGGNRGFTLHTDKELLNDVRRAYRRLTFSCTTQTPLQSYVTNEYLNRCASDTAALIGGLKPLICDAQTSVAQTTADIYLKYDANTQRGCIVIRYKENGAVVMTKELYTGFGEQFGYGVMVYKSITLENIVDVRNQTIGFRIIITAVDNHVITYSSLNENDGILYRGIYPMPFGMVWDSEGGKAEYTDIKVLLPDDLVGQVNYYGGDVLITYDVEQSV